MTTTIGTSELLPTWAATGTSVKPSEVKTDLGWVNGEQPPHEYANWLIKTLGESVNHILKNGVPEWNTTTQYEIGDVSKVGGVIYQAKADNLNSSPPNVNWQAIAPYPVKNSVAIDDGSLQLLNDNTAPGNDKFYGTSPSGVKGWQSSLSNGFVTGDLKGSFGSAEQSGWVRANGRLLGSAASGANERANADCEDLFIFLWDNCTTLAVSGGRGASGADDFTADKTLTLPDSRNNALAFVDGMGNANTDRLTGAVDGKTPGEDGGLQNHTLTKAEMEHQHEETVSSPAKIGKTAVFGSGSTTLTTANEGGAGTSSGLARLVSKIFGSTATAHNNTQPTLIAGGLYIKL